MTGVLSMFLFKGYLNCYDKGETILTKNRNGLNFLMICDILSKEYKGWELKG